MRAFALGLLLSALILPSCKRSGEELARASSESAADGASNDRLSKVVVDNEQGFVDLTFPLDSPRSNVDGGYFVARGVLDGAAVGFAARVDSSGVSATRGVLLESVGPESDTFLRALQKLYGPSSSSARMKHSTRFTSVLLEGSRGSFKYKLFGGENDEQRYCEVYLDIDLARGAVQLADKDPEYHEPLLALLREP